MAGAAHPDALQSAVRPLQVGFRYEITGRSVYLRSARISYYSSPAVSSYPHATLDDLSAINAILFTTPDPDAQREGEDKWALTLGRGRAVDEKEWPEDGALYFPHGIYVAISSAETDGEGAQVLLSLEFVEREHYCPARTSPQVFYNACGTAPEPGPAVAAEAWSNSGQEIAQFLVTLGSGKTITALDGTGIATT